VGAAGKRFNDYVEDTQMDRHPRVTYRYSRLTFHRDSIEPLADDDLFRIETPLGNFELTKKDFYVTFPRVVQSISYLANGLYNYKKVPNRAMRFLVGQAVSSAPGLRSQSPYSLPPALKGMCTEAAYKKWLHRKAIAHVVRDRKRWKKDISVSDYKKAIHDAVLLTGRTDAYTGEDLAWGLISKYDNDASRHGKVEYKKRFSMLPTVDHAGEHAGVLNFKICSWRTNDAKSDLSLKEFLELCQKVLSHCSNAISEK
jgi:hypothetical protein